jgi:hypothetical protein
MLGLHASVNRVVDRLHLSIRPACADHEEVGEAGDSAQVQLEDVKRLAIGGERSDRASRVLGLQRYSPFFAM